MSEINQQILESLSEPEISQFPDFCAAISGLVAENVRMRTALADLIGHARFVATNFDIHYAHLDDAVDVLEAKP